jgi:predicted lipid-binding transport protein (Tim44 family)
MNQKSLLIEGLSDAIGFVGGALLGYWIGRMLGLDIFAEGYGNAAIGGILLVGLGGGFGLQVARRWRRSHRQNGKARAREDLPS